MSSRAEATSHDGMASHDDMSSPDDMSSQNGMSPHGGDDMSSCVDMFPEHPIFHLFGRSSEFWKILDLQIFSKIAHAYLDVLSVPEALVHSGRILEAPAVVQADPWLKS